MTEDDAIQIAKEVAKKHGWVWRGRVRASHHKPWKLFGWLFRSRPCWHVASNVGMRGCNVRVLIDAESGEVLRKAFGPR